MNSDYAGFFSNTCFFFQCYHYLRVTIDFELMHFDTGHWEECLIIMIMPLDKKWFSKNTFSKYKQFPQADSFP